MPEYDAFGREIGEDTLAPWRPDAPRDEAREAASVAPAPAPERAVRAHRPRAPRRRRGLSRLIVLLVVLGVGANLAVDAGQELGGAIPGVQAEPEGPPPAGLRAGSLLRPAALRDALERLRGERAGRVHTLRLDPERIDATLVRGDRLSAVQLTYAGDLRTVSSSAGGGHLEPLRWAQLDPAAPARLARAAAAKLRRPVTRIDYLVATPAGGEVTWGAYFHGGQIFQGDARGRLLRRVS